ncbi:antirepressor [Rodentibacter rarus]|uniref:P22AR C-terminal domain-containing protein n=1 Tax=Rodentibacter rarus TaxID=1908260 RepID=UPI0009879D6F|nr:P22AR C-terminal domain-containing protein [Rodentibacter rarus]OOF39858.1 antirepressor [Rodentibacter rarus]
MTTLTFQDTTLSVINQNNQIWLNIIEVGKALGYSNPLISINNLYNRHQDEFTPNMTALIDMRTNGGVQKVRIFSLRGCHLIGMLSHTKVAKDFRKWVLDILDKETAQPKQLALPEPEKKFTFEFTEYELEQLVWLWCGHRQMNTLLGDMIDPLDAIGSRFTGIVISHHHEYQRQYKATLPTIQRLITPFKQSDRLNWTRAINLIKQ